MRLTRLGGRALWLSCWAVSGRYDGLDSEEGCKEGMDGCGRREEVDLRDAPHLNIGDIECILLVLGFFFSYVMLSQKYASIPL